MRPHCSTCNFVVSVALFCTLFILGCGGSGSSSSKVSSSTPAPASTFTLSAGAPKVSLSAGGSPVTVSLAITGSAGFASTVQVVATGAPAGVTVSPVTISGAPNGTASVSITASSSVAPGTYTLTFTATDSTQQTQSVAVSLTIAAAVAPPPPPQSPSYSLSITGPSQLPQGGTATATLTATYVGGFDSPVSVAPVFLPTGISITSGPIVFTAANLSQTVTFAASSSTVLATYPIVFTGTGGDLPAQTVSFSLTVVAPPPLPSGYVYITTPAGINAYASPGQGAALSLIPGSPFQVTGTVIGSAGVPNYSLPGGSPQYLVSYDATNVYTYSIGSNGAVGPQVSTLSTQAYSGNVCGAPINAVTSGQLVYVGLGSTTTPSCYANQTFNVSNTGLLTFLGSTELDKPVTITPPVFSGWGSAAVYAYGLESPLTGACEDELVGYTLESNGTLNFGSNVITSLPTAQQGSTYATKGPIAAAGAQDGLVALAMYQENGPCGTAQPAQLALFNLDNAGNLISQLPDPDPPYGIVPPQSYENMPALTGTPSSMAFALNGTFTIPLAVAGTGGLQVYVETLLEGNTQNIPEGPAVLSTSLLSTPITQVAWDLNNLYAFNGQQLFVFYSTMNITGSVPNALSTGAPFAISGSNMVVVPIGGPQ
jgi:hypothetical protein